jgi:3'-phosphoadenosine 5'-phosphosulfate (PAPS) 3'-phosphatase
VVQLADGNALRYNKGESLLNPNFLAFGDPDCYRRWSRG